MSIFPTIALIGAGNMGRGLISGLFHHGHPSDKLWAADPSPEKLAELKASFSIHTTEDNHQAVQAADVVILAIKPQLMASVLSALAETMRVQKPLVISIAAGVRTQTIAHYLGSNINNDINIVRAMPNMPAVIGRGATGLYTAAQLTHQEKEWIEHILTAVGIVRWLSDEAQLDVVTALSGSGPAYFYLIFEALEKAAIELGLPQEIAHVFTLQTALGAAEMAGQTELPLSELRKQVTSKGGTTEKGLQVLAANHIDALFKAALEAAKNRAQELAKQSGA